MGGFSSGAGDSDDVTEESEASSTFPGVGRSICSLDQRLGPRKVATRTSVAFVCEIGELSKSLGTTCIGVLSGSMFSGGSVKGIYAPHPCAVSGRKPSATL